MPATTPAIGTSVDSVANVTSNHDNGSRNPLQPKNSPPKSSSASDETTSEYTALAFVARGIQTAATPNSTTAMPAGPKKPMPYSVVATSRATKPATSAIATARVIR